jgi:hypothetical protein
MPIPWFPWPHWHQKIQHAEAQNRLATFATCECVRVEMVSPLLPKKLSNPMNLPSSGMPAVASGPYLRSDLFGGSFSRDGPYS